MRRVTDEKTKKLETVDTVHTHTSILNNKGITLIALVVTIIILLILAGISIYTITQNGLFEKAKIAKEKQENIEQLENTTLSDYENEIEKYIDNTRENSNFDIMTNNEFTTPSIFLDRCTILKGGYKKINNLVVVDVTVKMNTSVASECSSILTGFPDTEYVVLLNAIKNATESKDIDSVYRARMGQDGILTISNPSTDTIYTITGFYYTTEN